MQLEEYSIIKKFVILLQIISIISIGLLIEFKKNMSIIKWSFSKYEMNLNSYYGLTITEWICAITFLGTYIISVKVFGKYSSTKMYTLICSIFMVLTLLTKLIFG